MLMSEIENKDEVSLLVMKELREVGIKIRNDKKTNKIQVQQNKVFYCSI